MDRPDTPTWNYNMLRWRMSSNNYISSIVNARNMEEWVILKFLVKRTKTADETLNFFRKAYVEHLVPRIRVFECFKRSSEESENEPWKFWPSREGENRQKCEKVKESLGTDLCESVGNLAEELNMNWGTVIKNFKPQKWSTKIYDWENITRNLYEKEESARIWVFSEIKKNIRFFLLYYCDQMRRYLLFPLYFPPPPRKVFISCNRKFHCLLNRRKLKP